jgi:hypothetical protein
MSMIAGIQLLMPGVVTGAGRSPPDSPAEAIDQPEWIPPTSGKPPWLYYPRSVGDPGLLRYSLSCSYIAPTIHRGSKSMGFEERNDPCSAALVARP